MIKYIKAKKELSTKERIDNFNQIIDNIIKRHSTVEIKEETKGVNTTNSFSKRFKDFAIGVYYILKGLRLIIELILEFI